MGTTDMTDLLLTVDQLTSCAKRVFNSSNTFNTSLSLSPSTGGNAGRLTTQKLLKVLKVLKSLMAQGFIRSTLALKIR
jgi:hypothetical protein